MPPIIDNNKCAKCGMCIDICPEDILSQEDDKTPKVVCPNECWHCAACVIDCPKEAIRLYIPLPMRV
jgi:MinD superfamily P-loop ATPase containing an inserted ferredoxin domain